MRSISRQPRATEARDIRAYITSPNGRLLCQVEAKKYFTERGRRGREQCNAVHHLVGSAVYNDHDEKIDSINNVILGKGNNADKVIVSVGGLHGAGAKLITCPTHSFGSATRNTPTRTIRS